MRIRMDIPGPVRLGTYESELLSAYEGEILGCVFFRAMGAHYRNDLYAKRAFSILAEVEYVTETLLHELLVHHHITPPSPSDAKVKGYAVAKSLCALDWLSLLEAMERRITPACHRYHALRRITPSGDEEPIALLLEHEQALESFVQHGVARRNQALRPCLRYLRLFKPKARLRRSPPKG